MAIHRFGLRRDCFNLKRKVGRNFSVVRRQTIRLIARSIAPRRQDHTGAPEPGNVDGAVVERSLARQEIAPGFDGQFGFPDIFEKGDLAVIAAPAAGFEQLGEVIQPLLGQDAPARDGVAPACQVSSMCHQIARKEKNGRRRNRTESVWM